MSPWIYLLFLLLVICIGVVIAFVISESPLMIITLIVLYVIVVAIAFPAILLLQLRRAFLIAGTRTIDYQLDNSTLTVTMGRDRYEMPRDDLHLVKTALDSILVRRTRPGASRRRGVPLVLFCDDPGIAGVIADQFR